MMQTVTSTIEFVSANAAGSSDTGDASLFFSIVSAFLVVVILLFLFRKHKKPLFSLFAVLAVVGISACALNLNSFTASAQKLENTVSPKFTAKIGQDIQIEDGYIQYFSEDSSLAFYGLTVTETADTAGANWIIKYDDREIFNGVAQTTQNFDNPLYIDNNVHIISIQTDMLVETAQDLIGQSPISLDFSLQEECAITGKAFSSLTHDPLEDVSVQFFTTDGRSCPVVYTDETGEYTVMAPQNTTGHIHFAGAVAAYDTEDFTVQKHMTFENVELNLIPTVTIHEKMEYTGSPVTGVELDASVIQTGGDITATDIGTYTVNLKPTTGYAWEDGSTDSKDFYWSIYGAYVRAQPNGSNRYKLTFYYGKDFATGDHLLLNAENATQKTEVPWMTGSIYANLYNAVIFDSSMKDYEISQSAWWFDGFHKLESIEGISNLNFAFDPAKHGMESMFNSCQLLKTLDLSNFNTSNCPSFSWMFYGCFSLEDIFFGDIDTSSVTLMNHMFDFCSSLIWLDLSAFNTTNVTDMSYMFGYDETAPYSATSKLQGITFGSNFDTSNVTTMERMFYKCEKLVLLDLQGFNTFSVTNFKHMFDSCSSLTSIYCSFGTAWAGDGEDMFAGATSLVGGAGTAYDPSHVDISYAREDQGLSGHGYFTGELPPPSPVPQPAEIFSRAQAELGKPYAWGAAGPDAYDAAGLVSYACAGVHAHIGTTYTFLNWPRTYNPVPGDICVSTTLCGIYAGGGQMIHAPGEGLIVCYGPVQGGMIYVKYPGS
ncbi:MAG: BspA family leucine-rich repeat surface protein [Coriobacteriales bacterium]|nr:BspA family leucine-rich repeat surface protein [Coriobacteriales bacterium]